MEKTEEISATPRCITQPDDWWGAFASAAEAAGVTLSEWIGERCYRALPKEVRAGLSRRSKRGKRGKGA